MADPLPAARRAAAYGRISEDDQDKREGVDEQLTRAQVHIERRGWDLMASFRDDDLSAYSGKPRPGYDALMAEVQAGRVDTIVVRHLDRLWRDDLEAAKGRVLLRQRHVLIAEYGGMEYPMWTAHGQHMARTMSGNGTFESDIKSERVREAAERRAGQGRMNGPCPYGWRREYERTTSGRVIESTKSRTQKPPGLSVRSSGGCWRGRACWLSPAISTSAASGRPVPPSRFVTSGAPSTTVMARAGRRAPSRSWRCARATRGCGSTARASPTSG
jgi:DNA invertase Pin-like site-specific DNA recombinase